MRGGCADLLIVSVCVCAKCVGVLSCTGTLHIERRPCLPWSSAESSADLQQSTSTHPHNGPTLSATVGVESANFCRTLRAQTPGGVVDTERAEYCVFF